MCVGGGVRIWERRLRSGSAFASVLHEQVASLRTSSHWALRRSLQLCTVAKFKLSSKGVFGRGASGQKTQVQTTASPKDNFQIQKHLCRVEELALPTRAIQLSGEELSTDEAASAELHEAEAVHRTRNSCCLFKATPTTPCICREQQLEIGVSNKRLKHTLQLLLHCGGPAELRLLRTVVPHTAVVVWTGTTGT